MLRMSDNEKIDMAIKYCTNDYANKLNKVRTWFYLGFRDLFGFNLQNFLGSWIVGTSCPVDN